MKKLMLIASALCFAVACDNTEIERNNHNRQKDSLISVLQEREDSLNQRQTAMNEFIGAFNEIERNLDSVAVRQRIITKSADRSGELRGSQRERINENIKAINDLMEKNAKTIADLQRRLKKSAGKNKKLEETVATLTEQLSQKNQELADLNEKLNSLNAQVARLQTNLDSMGVVSNKQYQTITEHLTALHTAYYVIGKTKELREAKIIDKKGGVLGIGRTSKLSQDFDPSKFTRIDYTTTSTIPVNSDDVRIITNHPSDSYRLETEGKDQDKVRNLVITNPEKFWSVSKYLVIAGNPVNGERNVTASR